MARNENLLRVGAVVLAASAMLASYGTHRGGGDFTQAGYAGLFVLAILANATVVLPAPGIAVAFVGGGALSPFWVGVLVGVGAVIGELSGYLAGFGSQAVVARRRWYRILAPQMRPRGGLVIAVLAFIPSPLFDVAGIVAGASGMPMYRFAFWCAVGKIPKMLVFSFAGAYGADRLF